jgi:outer membrane protein
MQLLPKSTLNIVAARGAWFFCAAALLSCAASSFAQTGAPPTVVSPTQTAAAAPALAARPGELKIGFVNSAKLLRESAPAQRAFKKLEREFATRYAEIERLAKRFRDASAAYEKEQVTITEAERRNRQRELETLSRDLQRAQSDLRDAEKLRQNEEVAVLEERMEKVIFKIAETERFDLILQGAVYASPRIDITDRVLKALAD